MNKSAQGEVINITECCTGKSCSGTDRYVLMRDIRKKTVLTDRKSGRCIIDTEDSFIREYPVVKLLVSVSVTAICAAAFLLSCKHAAKRKKLVKAQKKEIKRLRKICNSAAKKQKKSKK